MVMGSLGIFKKVLSPVTPKKVDLPKIKLIKLKKGFKNTPLSQEVEKLMKTCDQNDNLLPLAFSGIHDLIKDGISYINDNKVNLVDILPSVIAPSLDSPENCFFYQEVRIPLI